MENHLWKFQPKRTHISWDMNETINKKIKRILVLEKRYSNALTPLSYIIFSSEYFFQSVCNIWVSFTISPRNLALLHSTLLHSYLVYGGGVKFSGDRPLRAKIWRTGVKLTNILRWTRETIMSNMPFKVPTVLLQNDVGWEPEGRYRYRFCTSITPFWLSTDLCQICEPWLQNTQTRCKYSVMG